MDAYLLTSEPSALTARWDEASAPPPCARCGRRSAADPAAGYVADRVAGPQLDLMHGDPLYACLLAFRDWYEDSGLGGLDFEALPGTRGDAWERVTFPGRAELAAAASGAHVADECPACGFQDILVEGPWVLDQARWDGSAFFHVPARPAVGFCTQQARAALEAGAIRGPVFIELEMVVI